MNLSPEVKAYLSKAHHALEVAWKLQTGGELADAAGKAYYAMFYAAQALLKAYGRGGEAFCGCFHVGPTICENRTLGFQVSSDVPQRPSSPGGCRLQSL